MPGSDAAQAALDVPGYQEPYCGCGRIVEPLDCDANVAPVRARAREFEGRVRADCRERWKAACEAQYGWMECAKADPAMIASQCDAVVTQWRTEVAQPQLAEARAMCAAQNEGYRNQCITQMRPQICAQCDTVIADIQALETELAETRAQGGVGGPPPLVMLSSDEPDPVAVAREKIPAIERRLIDKRSDYELLKTQGYCG